MPTTPPIVFFVAAVALASVASPAAAEPISLDIRIPTFDRWMYPFNGTPGFRPMASTFATVDEPDFDERDAQFLIGFDLFGKIPTGLGQSRYRILEARLITTISDGGLFRYDPTFDSYFTHLPPDDPDFLPDTDLGRPVELFGVGFRGTATLENFVETSSFGPINPPTPRSRRAFATDFHQGVARDVSNSVEDRFDPTPFAIGQAVGVSPGAIVPTDTEIIFDLDLDNPDVVTYLQRALDNGRLRLMIATLHFATGGPGGGSGQFPVFYTKENKFAAFDDVEPRLQLTVEIIDDASPDLNGDGVVNAVDLSMMLGSWGPCPPAPEPCAADLTGDGVVNASDLSMLLGSWEPI